MCYLFKVMCYIKRNAVSRFRYLLYSLIPGLYFKKIGKGTVFHGSITVATIGYNNITVGSKCCFGRHVFLSASQGGFIKIGNGSSVNTGCHVVAVYGIEIGDDTMIAEYVSIRDQNHSFDDREQPINRQGFNGYPIKIGSNVWIGRGVFVGPGVEIGDGVIIGANSVVNRDIPSNSIAVGCPARVIKKNNHNK